jgi:F0F1-type ATP synthase assembly protein I
MVTAVSAAIAWVVADAGTAAAAAFGGLIVLLPGLWFARKALIRTVATEPKAMLGAFYKAEFGKLLLTTLLFFIGALWFGKHFAALMLTCIACLAMNWLMLAVAKN